MKRLLGKRFTGIARFARFAKSARGAIAVEAAFALPVILAAFFILCELAHMVLTVEIAETAVNAALVRFRADGTLGPDAATNLRQGVAAFSHGYLNPGNVTRVTVEPYETLDAMGNQGGNAASGSGSEKDEGNADGDFASQTPAWHIVVVIHKDFITPLPRLLLTKRQDFTYRYERVVGYFNNADENGEL